MTKFRKRFRQSTRHSIYEFQLIEGQAQCKRLGANATCEIDVLDELVDGSDFYRELVIPKKLKNLPLKLILVTTGKFDRATVTSSREKGVELIDGASLRKLSNAIELTYAEILALDTDRVRNIDNFILDFKRRLG